MPKTPLIGILNTMFWNFPLLLLAPIPNNPDFWNFTPTFLLFIPKPDGSPYTIRLGFSIQASFFSIYSNSCFFLANYCTYQITNGPKIPSFIHFGPLPNCRNPFNQVDSAQKWTKITSLSMIRSTFPNSNQKKVDQKA